MSKNYFSLSILIKEEFFEQAYFFLSDVPFIGMEEKYDEIILYFEEKNWNDKIHSDLLSFFNNNMISAKISSVKILPEKNWNEEWEKNLEPIIISKDLIISPESKQNLFDCKNKILINPKMSFGTGHHSTTKLLAIMIENFFKENNSLKKDIWIDAGTGTGILAIIAAKLGAKKVYAFDKDEWALENSKENIALNKVNHIVNIEQCEIENFVFPESNCVCANLFLGLIIKSFPVFWNSLAKHNGILFVSGVLLFDREELLFSAKENGFFLLDEMQELEWCCFKFGLAK